MFGRVQPIFPEATVFVIAAGPSVAEVDLEDIRGFPTIVVNRSFEAAPWADVLYFSDRRFYRWHKEAILAFAGIKFTATHEKHLKHPAITNLRKYKMKGLATDAHYVGTGNNSGYAAINVAYHAGAGRIVLIGFDMKSQNGRQHWHENHPVVYKDLIYAKMIPHFQSLVEPLTAVGVECINTSMDSAITCFPKVPLAKIMDETWFREESQLRDQTPA